MDFPERPNPKETDEDLLNLQKEFIQNKLKPSVTVIKCQRQQKTESDVAGQSNIDTNVSKTEERKQSENDKCLTDINSTPAVKKTVSWLGETATAKAVAAETAAMSSDINALKSHSTKDDMKQTQGRPKSIFALRMEQARFKKSQENIVRKKTEQDSSECSVKNNFEEVVSDFSNMQDSARCAVGFEGFGDHSYILSGPESSEIHQENVQRLSSMSVEEIKLERERLMSQLSPGTISFLASRRKKTEVEKDFSVLQNKGVSSSPRISDSQKPQQAKRHAKFFGKSVARTLTVESAKGDAVGDEDELRGLPINPNEAKQWLHMDVVEKEKLQWMKDIPPVSKVPGPDEPFAARFDFEGNLMPYVDASTEVNRGLHNHGDEPARPGYTLQELLQFTRSAVQQQRVLGLTALGNVITKTKLARYDQILEQKLLRQLLDAGVFLLLRFSMDDPVTAVASAAATAMCSLLFNPADEACLDYLLGCEGGLVQPTLQVVNLGRNKEEENEEEELKDYELIQLDVMKGALRTNLVLRLGYLLDVMRITPGPALDLLTVLSRHTPETVGAVVGCSGLLSTIRKELLGTRISDSVNPGYGEPCSKALRLFRVLVCRSRAFAITAVDKFNIMDSIMAYISMSTSLPSSNLQGLVIGAFYLWQSLLSYGLCAEALSELHPILMRQLHYHAELTSAVGEDAAAPGHELATALAGVLEKVLLLTDIDIPASAGLLTLLVACAQKWLKQMTAVGQAIKSFSWSAVKMMGATIRCLAIACDRFWDDNFPETQQLRNNLQNLIVNFFLPFMRSGALTALTRNLRKSSHLLSKSESGSKRDAPNLPSLASIDWGEEIVPVGLRDFSPLPLVGALTQLIGVLHSHSFDPSEECLKYLLRDTNLINYLRDIATSPLKGSSHWFARQELYTLYHLITLSNAGKESVPQEIVDIFGRLVLRFCGLIQNEDRGLFPGLLEHCVFDEQSLMWQNASSARNLEHAETIHKIFKRLPLISNVYLHVLGLRDCSPPNPLTRNCLTASPQGVETALPVDWPFAPIMLLYGRSISRDGGGSSSDGSEDVVVASLEFLFLSEIHWPNPWPSISATAFWCRISLIFLCGSDYFLSPSIQLLTRANQQMLVRSYRKINFKEDIPGLSSFDEFYQELLLQFSAVSYGDNLFGAFVILPLQQRYNVQLRRLLWTEHTTVLRFLRTSEEEVGIPIEEFLEPTETDASVLAAYLQYLACAPVKNELLAKIASTHIRTFVKQRQEGNFAHRLYESILKINDSVLQQNLLS